MAATTPGPGAPRHTGLLDKVAAVADILAKDAAACDELGRITPVTEMILEERYRASVAGRESIPEGHGRAAPNEPLWQRLGEITARTLVIWGRDNRVQDYDNALFMLNRIPDVEIHVFGGPSLWVPFERARRFESLVSGFLEE